MKSSSLIRWFLPCTTSSLIVSLVYGLLPRVLSVSTAANLMNWSQKRCSLEHISMPCTVSCLPACRVGLRQLWLRQLIATGRVSRRGHGRSSEDMASSLPCFLWLPGAQRGGGGEPGHSRTGVGQDLLLQSSGQSFTLS